MSRPPNGILDRHGHRIRPYAPQGTKLDTQESSKEKKDEGGTSNKLFIDKTSVHKRLGIAPLPNKRIQKNMLYKIKDYNKTQDLLVHGGASLEYTRQEKTKMYKKRRNTTHMKDVWAKLDPLDYSAVRT